MSCDSAAFRGGLRLAWLRALAVVLLLSPSLGCPPGGSAPQGDQDVVEDIGGGGPQEDVVTPDPDAAGGCAADAECDDGDACNGAETCDTASGECQAAVAPECDDGNPCTDDGCDPATGCTAVANAQACDDGDACTDGDVCADSVCAGAAIVCDDGELCTDDGCDPAIGCTAVANTEPCDDGDACTVDDVCADSACAPGAARDCDDGDPCTVDLCDPALEGGCYTEAVSTDAATVAFGGVTEGQVTTEDVTPTVTVEGDNVAAIAITLNGEAFESGTPITEEGTYLLEVAVDDCYERTLKSSLAFIIDRSDPELTWELEPPANGAGWNNQPVTVVFKASDGLSSIATVSEPVLVEDQGAGLTFQGEAVDAAGNVATVTAVVNTDFKAPTVNIEAPVPNQGENDQFVTAESTITFTGTFGDDALSGFHLGLVTSSKLTTQFEFEEPGGFEVEVPLLVGVNTVIVSAADAAGNTGTASVCVIRDDQKPAVQIQFPPDGYKTAEAAIDVSGLAHDLVVGSVTEDDVVVHVNGLEASVTLGHFVVQGVPLEPGENVLEAIATDSVGQTSSHSVTVVRLDGAFTRLEIVSGNGQQGPITSQLEEPLVVQLLDPNDVPIAGAQVIFAVTDNDGTITADDPVAVSPKGRSVLVATDAEGLADAWFTLGSRAGAGLDEVTVSQPDAVASVSFHHSGTPLTPANLFVHHGQGQTGEVGKPLPMPLSVLVTDAETNPVDGAPVTFEVVEGGGKFASGTQVTVMSNLKGFADVVFTPGEPGGWGSQKVRASIPAPPDSGTAQGALFVASAFGGANPDFTSITGRVIDENEQPLQGVSIRFPAIEDDPKGVQTSADGTFTYQGAPPGFALMEIDGTTALVDDERELPIMTYEVYNVSGIDNRLDRPIYLLRLNEGKFVDGLMETVITVEELPGFELTVPAGTDVTFPDGSKEGVISITQVHFDQAPMSPVDGLNSRVLVTIQPPNVKFDPPAPLAIPNVDGYPPNRKVEMFSFDHDLEAFVPIGIGTVTADGTVIESDPGVGVVKTGWHCGSNPQSFGSSGAITASLSAVYPDQPDAPQVDLSGVMGTGASIQIPVQPDTTVQLQAKGQPGPDTHWEWCGSSNMDVNGPGCAGQTECEGTAKPASGSSNGERGVAKVIHICDSTKQRAEAQVELRICNVPPNRKVVSKQFGAGLPLGKITTALKNAIEAIGCSFECGTVCTAPMKACGDVCYPPNKPCDKFPGSACDKGDQGLAAPQPLKFHLTTSLESFDTCCPGCPNEKVTNGNFKIEAAASFGSECTIPGLGFAVNLGKFAKLQFGLFISFGVGAKAGVSVSTDNCCEDPPCFCFGGGLAAFAKIGGGLKAVAKLLGYKLASAKATIDTGINGEFKVDCKEVCGKINWDGITGQLKFVFLNGQIGYQSKKLVIVEGGTLMGDCWPLDPPSEVKGSGGGCPGGSPALPDANCPLPDVPCTKKGQSCGGEGAEPCCGDLSCKGGACSAGNCRDSGQQCGAGLPDCCGNLECADGVCKDPNCKPSGQSCGGSDGACCPGLSCHEGTCGDCKTTGDSCVSGDCCSGLACMAGTCGECSESGGSCTTADDCCGDDLLCSNGQCIHCRQSGENCSIGDCCGDLACVDSECGQCKADGEACAVPTDCCGALLCNGDVCGNCKVEGESCSNGQCCDPEALACLNGTCGACKEDGVDCADDEDCCGESSCTNGYCADCKELGDACGSADDCCSDLDCVGGSCCKKENHPCGADGDCCGDLLCIQGSCKPCSETGDGCADGGDCCDPLSCVGGQCCVGQGDACGADGDCCFPFQCINGQCDPCAQLGDVCADVTECCAGLACDGVCCKGLGGGCAADIDCCGTLLCDAGVCVNDDGGGGGGPPECGLCPHDCEHCGVEHCVEGQVTYFLPDEETDECVATVAETCPDGWEGPAYCLSETEIAHAACEEGACLEVVAGCPEGQTCFEMGGQAAECRECCLASDCAAGQACLAGVCVGGAP